MTTVGAEKVVLADGRDAVLRPLMPADRRGLEVLFAHTRQDNLYTRFFSIGADTVAKHLDHLFAGDPTVSSYVLLVGERVVGVADVERLDASSAEVAFLVADDTHGCGVATLLLERAAAEARSAGVAWFVADVLAVNHLMLQVFADVGFPVTTHRVGSAVSLRMSTALDPATRDAAAERSVEALAHRGHVRDSDADDDHAS